MKIEFLETIKICDGKIYNIEYHQKRYESVLQSYAIEHCENLQRLINAPKKGLYRCRVVYDLKNNIRCSYHPYVKRTIESLKLVVAEELEYSKKYANRDALDRLFKKRGVCDDILIVQNGLVCDTTIANVAFFDRQRWVTPKKPLLAGTTRQRLLESGFLQTADIAVEDLKKFTKMAVMNAMVDFDIIADKKIEEIMC